MAASATARRARAAKVAPARAPARAPSRPRQHPRGAPARPRTRTSTGGFVPVVGRTAVAVGGIADSGPIVRLTRGRLWIGALAVLLVGIVALNVAALRFSASSSEAGRAADQLEQQNSALRAQLATSLSHEEIQVRAGELGLRLPAPGELRYRKPSSGDAAEAARRIRAGELNGAPPAASPITPAPVPSDTAPPAESVAGEVAAPAPVADPAASAPAAPTATAPAAVAPTTEGAVLAP